MTKRPLWRRGLAGVLLAGVSLSLVAAPLAADTAAERCPPVHAIAGGPALVAGGTGACHHTDAGVCASAAACTTLGLAVSPSSVSLVVSAGQTSWHAPRVQRILGLLRLGPPPPPPNS